MTSENELIDFLKKHKVFALDTETYGLEHQDDAFAVFLWTESNKTNYHYFAYHAGEPEKFRKITGIFNEHLTKEHTMIMHNASFDLVMLMKSGLTNLKFQIYCTLIMEKFLYNEHASYTLAACAARPRACSTETAGHYAALQLKKDDRVAEYIKANKLYGKTSKGTRKPLYNKVPLDLLIDYGLRDAKLTWKLWLIQGRGSRDGVAPFDWKAQMITVKAMAKAQMRGVKVDRNYACELRSKIEYELNQAVHSMGKWTKTPYKAGPKWLAATFEENNIPCESNPDTGNPVFDKKALQRLDHPIAKSILRMRSLQSKNNNYLTTILNNDVSTIHAGFNTFGTVTGRFSCTDPNLQNLPKNSDFPDIRRCYRARHGMKFACIDYSQQEFRLAADYACMNDVIDQIRNGEDIHANVGDRLGVDRDMGKTLNFAILYGTGPEKLGDMLGCSKLQASKHLQRYFNSYPKMRRFIDMTAAEAIRNGYIETYGGRRLYFENHSQAYKAVNYKIQGGCADIIKRAIWMVNGYIEGKDRKINLLLQIHDELIFEVPHDYRMEQMQPIINLMTIAYTPIRLPMQCTLKFCATLSKTDEYP